MKNGMNTVMKAFLPAFAAILFVMNTVVCAQETHGGDVFASGANASLSTTTGRDAFVAGLSATLDGNVGGDAHAAGFDVDVDAAVGADLYASGGSVSIGGAVGADVTAGGFSVRLRPGSSVGGNARLMGGSVKVEGPISGSLAATGGAILLDAPIDGDVLVTGGDITFGPNARIAGQLEYSAPSRIDIPESVIESDRVRYVESDNWRTVRDLRDMAGDHANRFWPSMFGMFAGFVVTLAFLLAIAAFFLAVAPQTVEDGRRRIVERPGASLLTGFLGLATLIGLVPVSAMTLVGIPLIPIAVLTIVAAWILSYALGAYALSLRIATAFRPEPGGNVERLLMLAAGLAILALLNFVPVAGWLLNLTVVLLGLGAIIRLATWRASGDVTAIEPDGKKE